MYHWGGRGVGVILYYFNCSFKKFVLRIRFFVAPESFNWLLGHLDVVCGYQ